MSSRLGEFLRARRQLTTPDQVGLRQAGDRRRTPGLRRQEVAMLAGVSIDYYTRLEQGRERRPSDQVLGALAGVLQLGPEAARHLHDLARLTAGDGTSPEQEDRVHPDILRLMETWHDKPALVVNRLLDILVQNSAFEALYEGLEHRDNIMRLTFLEPATREIWLDWEDEAHGVVAHLRAAAGTGCDRALLELVEELSRASEDFRRMWARHDVRTKTPDAIRFRYPDVGELSLSYQALSIDGAPGQKLVVFQAEPGSPSERALAGLRAVTPLRSAEGRPMKVSR
ncbi:helix-turn-helix transcriptional regulator [Planotetraspora mira]|nr:helix-turn-helix transcriptional regulator [Planotetraspora mira]